MFVSSLKFSLSHETSLESLVKRPDFKFKDLAEIPNMLNKKPELSTDVLVSQFGVELANQIVSQIEIGIKYAGYIDKQKEEINRMNESNHISIPDDFDFNLVTPFSTEVKQKLTKYRPKNIGEAASISGVPPSAIGILMVYLRKHKHTMQTSY